MRTKLLLGAAVLAAGALSAMADNVYSLNVVGYVNVSTVGGGNYNYIANPLNNSAGNWITNLFPSSVAQDGDQVVKWDPVIQDFSTNYVATYRGLSQSWDSNFQLNPGEAVFYLNAGNNATVTFVGEVQQGTYTEPVGIVGGGSFNAVASSAPIGGIFTNSIVGITPQDGDQAYIWNADPNVQDWDGNYATYRALSASWDNLTVTNPPGYGIFYLGAGNDQPTWTRTFTVQ